MSEGIVEPKVPINQETPSVYVHESGQVVAFEQSTEIEKLMKCKFLAELAAKGSINEVKTLAKHFVRAQQLAQKAETTDHKTTQTDSVILNQTKNNHSEELDEVRANNIKVADQIYPEHYTKPVSLEERNEQEVLTEDQVIVIKQNEIEAVVLPDTVTEVVTKLPQRDIEIVVPAKELKTEVKNEIPQPENMPEIVPEDQADFIKLETVESKNDKDDSTIELSNDSDETVEVNQLMFEFETVDKPEEIEETYHSPVETNEFFQEVNLPVTSYEIVEEEIFSEMSAFYAEITVSDESDEEVNLPVLMIFKKFTEELVDSEEEIDNFDEIVSQVDRIFEVYESFVMAGLKGHEIEVELVSSIKALMELLGVEDPLSSIAELIQIYDLDFLIKNIEYFRILINEKYRKEFKSLSLDNDISALSSDDSNQSIFSWILSMTTLFSPIKV